MDQKIVDKVFSKTATPGEARGVALWLATDEGQLYLSQLIDNESQLESEALFDDDIPAKRMKKRFLSQLNVHIRIHRFWIAAAVFIPFLLLTGAFTYITHRLGVFQSTEMAEFVVPYGEQLNVVLQDGTQVQLNSGSRLQYPKYFGMYNRKVHLTGEAYFTVANELNRPFLIDLNEIKIRVTGTRFNVRSYSDDNTILVLLEEGSVNIKDKTNTIYPMKMGQSAEYDKVTGICNVLEAPDKSLHTAWRTKSLSFYRTPLKELLKTLERQYEVKFDVNDTLVLNYRFSIATSKVNLNEVLSDLEKVSNIRFMLNADNCYSVKSIN